MNTHQLTAFATSAALAVAIVGSVSGSGDLSFDHLSFNVADPAKAAAWYADHLKGTLDGTAAVRFGSIRMSFRRSANSAGSAGSVIDHLAFSVANIDRVEAEVRADGASVVGPTNELKGMLATFVDDPWGIRLEFVRDPTSVGLHHIHLLAVDPAVMSSWLVNVLGGDRSSVAGLQTVKCGPVWVAITRVNQDPVPSAGRAIDHLGWRTPDLTTAAERLRAREATFTSEPRRVGDLQTAFIEGPDHLRVEVVQR